MPADGSAAAVGERLHALQSACRAAHAAAIQSTIRQIEAYLPEAVGTLRSEAPAEAAVNSLIELLLAVLEACGKEQPAQQVLHSAVSCFRICCGPADGFEDTGDAPADVSPSGGVLSTDMVVCNVCEHLDRADSAPFDEAHQLRSINMLKGYLRLAEMMSSLYRTVCHAAPLLLMRLQRLREPRPARREGVPGPLTPLVSSEAATALRGLGAALPHSQLCWLIAVSSSTWPSKGSAPSDASQSILSVPDSVISQLRASFSSIVADAAACVGPALGRPSSSSEGAAMVRKLLRQGLALDAPPRDRLLDGLTLAFLGRAAADDGAVPRSEVAGAHLALVDAPRSGHRIECSIDEADQAARSALWSLLQALSPSAKIQSQLDAWVDGAVSEVVLMGTVEPWRDRALGLLSVCPMLFRWARLDGVAQKNKLHENLVIEWLALLAELAPGRSPHAEEPWPADPLSTPTIVSSVTAVLAALCDAVGMPPVLLRRQLMGGVCRCLNARLLAAEAGYFTHRTRRLARALAASVCALPRPHLSGASDSHKLLPLLLGWSEVVDPPARSAVLHAVRHCVHDLRAPEVQWHGQLVLARLRKLLVFRDAIVLNELLPALHRAHEAAIGGLSEEEKREHIEQLLMDLDNEVLTVSDKPTARRLYARWLPLFFTSLGIQVCSRLPSLVDHSLVLLDQEVGVARAAIRMRGLEVAPTTLRCTFEQALPPVRDAIRVLESLLRAAWPRAAAHAPKALTHILAALVRIELLVEEFLPLVADACDTSSNRADKEPLLLGELADFVALLTLCPNGGNVCAGVIDLFISQIPPGAETLGRLTAAVKRLRPIVGAESNDQEVKGVFG